MSQLYPEILRACAGYLAHADVYFLDEDGEATLFRPLVYAALDDFTVTTKTCDEFTRLHLGAIRRYGLSPCPMTDEQLLLLGVPSGTTQPGVRSTARAILDAPTALLMWWCERLALS